LFDDLMVAEGASFSHTRCPERASEVKEEELIGSSTVFSIKEEKKFSSKTKTTLGGKGVGTFRVL
jgi:hypothetical protein